MAVSFIRSDSLWTTSAVFFALAGSLMVSYIRARVEGLGEECKVGFMQRPERVIAIGVGALVGEIGAYGSDLGNCVSRQLYRAAQGFVFPQAVPGLNRWPAGLA